MKGTNVATMVGDGSVRPTVVQKHNQVNEIMADKAAEAGAVKARKPPVRRCWGRVQWVDVRCARFRFELTQEGLLVHRKATRRKSDALLKFDRLANGGGHEWMDGTTTVNFTITDGGVEVRRGGSRSVKVLGFPALANLGRTQPELALV